MTFLIIAGHGENKNGSFDPGATGIIKKGEHKYFEENFFPAVKKHLPKNSDVVLFSQYNVYDYKNLVTLADKYGKNTVVIEMHYDAGSSSASGGHVIVHSAYAPDKYDLAIRDVIKKHIGIRYEHKGQKGISGRDNLGNCNRAKSAGLNYRLVELGFGTNVKDAKVMVDNADDVAKDFVRALLGEVLESVPTVPVKASTPVKTEDNRSKKFNVNDRVRLTSTAKKWKGSSDFSLDSFKSEYIVNWLNADGTIYIKPVGVDWGGNVLESDIEQARNNDIDKDDIVKLRDKATHWVGGAVITDGMRVPEYSVRYRKGNILYVDSGQFRGEVYDWDASKK